jgi:hypothetical protein
LGSLVPGDSAELPNVFIYNIMQIAQGQSKMNKNEPKESKSGGGGRRQAAISRNIKPLHQGIALEQRFCRLE